MSKQPRMWTHSAKRKMTPKQELMLDLFFKHGGDVHKMSEDCGDSPDAITACLNSYNMVKEIALRAEDTMLVVNNAPEGFTVSKEDRLRLLWKIAEQGVSNIYDREGNEVMQNAAASVSAIRTINEMLPGSLAPKEIDVSIDVNDTRSMEEVKASIQALTAEYNKLAAIDAPSEYTDYTEATESTNVDPSQ